MERVQQYTVNEVYQFNTEQLVGWVASSMQQLSVTVEEIRAICTQIERGLDAINQSLKVVLYDGDKPLKIYATLINYFCAPFLETLFLSSPPNSISSDLLLAQKGLNNYFKHPGCLTLPEAQLAQTLRETIEAIVKSLEQKEVKLNLLRQDLGSAMASNKAVLLDSEQIEPLISYILNKIQTDCYVRNNTDSSVNSEQNDKSNSEHSKRVPSGFRLFSKQIFAPAPISIPSADKSSGENVDVNSNESQPLSGSGVY